ncbi:sensor domain-containing diguanylate cyclase [Saccharospirillum mangrovi]|uniref:sensor domain-containing diguanylate cyclase n=1 Tax=Saccharospirillum mangrovi TaxID=2161747 RepID=UPI000D38B52B|nr:sensor domain-containing diguanylate cyclase [Saccharospirillum mangrovi]
MESSKPSIQTPADDSAVAQLLDVLHRDAKVKAAMDRLGVFVVNHRDYAQYPLTTPMHFDGQVPFADAWDWLQYIHPSDRPRVEEAWNAVIRGETDLFCAEYRYQQSDGEYRWLLNKGTVVHRTADGYPWVYVGADTDIEELKLTQRRLIEQQNELRDSLMRDPQLGIPNRRYLDEQAPRMLDDAYAEQSALTVLVCDLDNFKTLNDTLGHSVADGILMQVVGKIGDCLRDTDVIARFGGDEFVVLLGATDGDQAAQVAERILASVRTLSSAQHGTELAISIGGYSARPSAGETLWQFFEKADKALYRAKQQGRGCYVAAAKD